MTAYDMWKLQAPEEPPELCEHCTKSLDRCRCDWPERDDDELPMYYDGR